MEGKSYEPPRTADKGTLAPTPTLTPSEALEMHVRAAERAHDDEKEFGSAANSAAVKTAEEAIKAALLINGGSSVAMLAFIGTLVSRDVSVCCSTHNYHETIALFWVRSCCLCSGGGSRVFYKPRHWRIFVTQRAKLCRAISSTDTGFDTKCKAGRSVSMGRHYFRGSFHWLFHMGSSICRDRLQELDTCKSPYRHLQSPYRHLQSDCKALTGGLTRRLQNHDGKGGQRTNEGGSPTRWRLARGQ